MSLYTILVQALSSLPLKFIESYISSYLCPGKCLTFPRGIYPSLQQLSWLLLLLNWILARNPLRKPCAVPWGKLVPLSADPFGTRNILQKYTMFPFFHLLLNLLAWFILLNHLQWKIKMPRSLSICPSVFSIFLSTSYSNILFGLQWPRLKINRWLISFLDRSMWVSRWFTPF